MKTKRSLLLLVFVIITILIMLGCEGPTEFDTLSGKPEVIISDASVDYIINILNNEMVNEGYSIKEVTDYSAIYYKDLDSFQARLFYGSDFDSTPEGRIRYNFVEYENDIRVIVTLEIVTNPGTGYERVTDRTHSEDGEKYYETLKNIKQRLEEDYDVNINK